MYVPWDQEVVKALRIAFSLQLTLDAGYLFVKFERRTSKLMYVSADVAPVPVCVYLVLDVANRREKHSYIPSALSINAEIVRLAVLSSIS